MARSFFGPVVRPARGGVSGFASASRPKAAPHETQDTGNAGQAWQTWDRHSSRVRSPSVTRRGCPCPVRRTFADAFLASAHSMPTALRHPGCACRHTPALRARATPPPLPRSATFPRPTLRGLEDRGRPFGQPSALPATGQAKTGRMPVFRVQIDGTQIHPEGLEPSTFGARSRKPSASCLGLLGRHPPALERPPSRRPIHAEYTKYTRKGSNLQPSVP